MSIMMFKVLLYFQFVVEILLTCGNLSSIISNENKIIK